MHASRNLFVRSSRGLCLLALLAGVFGTAQAQTPHSSTDALWLAVSDRTLDSLRGGFALEDGLRVSFGITRALYINGELVTQMSLNFGQLSELTPVQAEQLSRQLAATSLVVQVGPGNSIAPEASEAAFATVIQNTLNNQQILQQTVINASSNALGLIKNLNTQATVDEALSRAIGTR
ncbi:hypothetical protein [Polaromonas sp.]|jgi:hypothetical protein|uniref:hypothetical protein n=1 Tax=Polaromonas sp. TaxID=1869339 RepID=UPI0037C674CD